VGLANAPARGPATLDRAGSSQTAAKELTPMKKDQLDLENKVVWIPDSKTPNGVGKSR
jgi:hypothetical protein